MNLKFVFLKATKSPPAVGGVGIIKLPPSFSRLTYIEILKLLNIIRDLKSLPENVNFTYTCLALEANIVGVVKTPDHTPSAPAYWVCVPNVNVGTMFSNNQSKLIIVLENSTPKSWYSMYSPVASVG